MKTTDQQLHRLFKAASAAPRRAPEALSFAAEARILARWRSSRSSVDSLPLLRFFRYGLACACAAVVLTAAYSWQDIRAIGTEEVFVTSPAVNWVWVQ